MSDAGRYSELLFMLLQGEYMPSRPMNERAPTVGSPRPPVMMAGTGSLLTSLVLPGQVPPSLTSGPELIQSLKTTTLALRLRGRHEVPTENPMSILVMALLPSC